MKCEVCGNDSGQLHTLCKEKHYFCSNNCLAQWHKSFHAEKKRQIEKRIKNIAHPNTLE
jgi:hypothetical protein